MRCCKLIIAVLVGNEQSTGVFVTEDYLAPEKVIRDRLK